MQGIFGPPPVATAGVCVWGAGDCGPKVNNVSQSFSQQLTENIKETMINKSTSIGATMSTSQVLSITNVDMSLCQNSSISNLSQKAVANYNFSMIEKSFDETSFTNMVRSAVDKTLKQNVDARSEALNGGNTGTVNNITQTYNNTVDRLVNSINYNDFKNVMSEMQIRQTIGLSGLKLAGKNCNISNISQDSMMELAASMLTDKITTEFTKLMKENEQKESTTSTSTFFASGIVGDVGRLVSGTVSSLTTGLSNLIGELSKPLMIIGIILVVIIIAYVINAAFFTGKAEGRIPEANAAALAEQPLPERGLVPEYTEPEVEFEQQQPQEEPQPQEAPQSQETPQEQQLQSEPLDLAPEPDQQYRLEAGKVSEEKVGMYEINDDYTGSRWGSYSGDALVAGGGLIDNIGRFTSRATNAITNTFAKVGDTAINGATKVKNGVSGFAADFDRKF